MIKKECISVLKIVKNKKQCLNKESLSTTKMPLCDIISKRIDKIFFEVSL